MKIDKTKFKDEKGRYIVQGLFLEDRYNADMAYYTFDGEHKEYKGKTFLSLKKLYLEMGDPTEYNFANTYLYDWDHWQRLCRNSIISKHIEKWREELSLALVADGLEAIISLANGGNSYQAAKFLADRGWDKSQRGRPSNDEIEGELQRRADAEEEYASEAKLLKFHKKEK